ncbi:CNH domain-containing protein [Mycena polygramma]|nr:CNH domain-containing protein [Mycena polygramma]
MYHHRSLTRMLDRSKLFDSPALAALRHSKSMPQIGANSNDTEYTPSPAQQQQQQQVFPIEIFEWIIDFLHRDKNTLVACSMVCRNWFPTSRYHLYTLCPLIPLAWGENCPNITTAVVLDSDSMLYGTNDGVYLSRNGTLVKVLKLPAVSQIGVLKNHNLLLVLSGRRLCIESLSLAISSTPALLRQRLDLRQISSNANFFQVGEHAGKRVVCIVHEVRYSSLLKLMEIVEIPAGAGTYTLRLLHSFDLDDRAHSVHIGNETIGVGLPAGFRCVDPESLVSFPLPVAPALPVYGRQKCRAIFRVDERFLLCYDRCAFFTDKAGISFEATFAIRWVDNARQFALSPPHLLAFTRAGLHAWHIDTGICVQTVRGPGIRLLSAAPRIVIKMGDGRIVALRCPVVCRSREGVTVERR